MTHLPRYFAITVLCLATITAGTIAEEPKKPTTPPQPSGPLTPPAAQPTSSKAEPSQAKKHTNRLSKETSPYLLQHAHNPVDWYPWGDEALAKAKQEGKLIFLSIGYSSCHWCHVMERESFLDLEIAALLNKNFVCIKVDREERPDIDNIYMTALQVYNQLAGTPGGGGWPLSMFLTSAGEPVFGGTYFPARDGDREGVIGFLTLVKKIQEVWTNTPDRLQNDAKTITKYTKQQLEGRRPGVFIALDDALYASVLKELAGQFDEQHGGFGFSPVNDHRPKFPEPSNLVYLLDRVKRTQDESAKRMLVATLEKMSLGGIRDHLGGGFHRYSTDRYWRIPHFEKMLYDNGQLASVYAEAYLLTGREDFRRVTEEILTFVLREMTDAGGGFFAALDADSEDEEGRFYRWEKAEVSKLLSKAEYDLFAAVYGLQGTPNFEQQYYVPQLSQPLSQIAAGMKLQEAVLEQQLVPIRQKLLAARSQRTRPLTDTKNLTADNGLMIMGLADAGRFLNEKARQPKLSGSSLEAGQLVASSQRYIAAATKAADFVLTNLRTKEGRLLRTYSSASDSPSKLGAEVPVGQAKLNAYLDDYAYLADGLIALYRATGEKKWLTAATDITAKQIEFFRDEKNGGFYFTSSDHEALLARSKNPVDGAVPSANSVSAGNLLFLAKESKRDEWIAVAEQTIQSSAALLEASPTAAPRMAVAIPLLLELKPTPPKTPTK